MDDIFKSFGITDLDILSSHTDAYINRILKLIQIIYYGTQSGNVELAKKVEKTYRPVIEILADKMEKEVEEYQKKHGEL